MLNVNRRKKLSMKKILLVLLGVINIVCVEKAGAQSFTTQYDTINATYHADQLTMYNNITNISGSPIKIGWRVINHNFPASWTTKEALGICDNVLCWQNDNNRLTGGDEFITNDIPAGNTEEQGMFYLVLVDINSAASGTYYMTIRLEDQSGGYQKDVSFIVNKWAAGVSNAAKADKNITLYPNPARNTVNLTFNPGAGVKTIALYNLIGKNVASYKVNNGSSKMALDISAVPSGIYYVRLQNAEGAVIATRRFTRQ